MAMCLSGKPSSTCTPDYKRQPGHPDPKSYQIIETHCVSGNLVALVKYPGARYYEGTKILLFQGTMPADLWDRGELDPHFSEASFSPFARFEPTAAGWTFAKALAKALPPVKGNRGAIGRCPECKTLVVIGTDPMCGECASKKVELA